MEVDWLGRWGEDTAITPNMSRFNALKSSRLKRREKNNEEEGKKREKTTGRVSLQAKEKWGVFGRHIGEQQLNIKERHRTSRGGGEARRKTPINAGKF